MVEGPGREGPTHPRFATRWPHRCSLTTGFLQDSTCRRETALPNHTQRPYGLTSPPPKRQVGPRKEALGSRAECSGMGLLRAGALGWGHVTDLWHLRPRRVTRLLPPSHQPTQRPDPSTALGVWGGRGPAASETVGPLIWWAREAHGGYRRGPNRFPLVDKTEVPVFPCLTPAHQAGRVFPRLFVIRPQPLRPTVTACSAHPRILNTEVPRVTPWRDPPWSVPSERAAPASPCSIPNTKRQRGSISIHEAISKTRLKNTSHTILHRIINYVCLLRNNTEIRTRRQTMNMKYVFNSIINRLKSIPRVA